MSNRRRLVVLSPLLTSLSSSGGITRRNMTHVRLWHIADMPLALTNVRFERNNGHDADVTRCLLLTQSGRPTTACHLSGANCSTPGREIGRSGRWLIHSTASIRPPW